MSPRKTKELKEIQETNVNELQTSTSTELQEDVGNTDTSLYKNKFTNIELIEYKIEELGKKVKKLENDIEEINMPLLDKINKYVAVISWILGIVGATLLFLFKLYDNGIQTHFANLEEKVAKLYTIESEFRADIKDLNKKQNYLEVKMVETKKK